MKEGLDFFLLATRLDEKFELIEAEYGLKGFAVIVKLYQRIYGEHGYYCEWTNDVALVFSRSIGEGASTVSEIVSAAIRRGIFDKGLFEKYHILTSSGIQKRYFSAVSRRKKVSVKSEYLLVNYTQISEYADIFDENVNIFPENVSNSAHSREEKSIEENILSGDDARARARAAFRMTWGREPTEGEYAAVSAVFGGLGGLNAGNEDLLEQALTAAANANAQNMNYVRGCFRQYAKRGITDNDSLWNYEYRRDKERGTI